MQRLQKQAQIHKTETEYYRLQQKPTTIYFLQINKDEMPLQRPQTTRMQNKLADRNKRLHNHTYTDNRPPQHPRNAQEETNTCPTNNISLYERKYN